MERQCSIIFRLQVNKPVHYTSYWHNPIDRSRVEPAMKFTLWITYLCPEYFYNLNIAIKYKEISFYSSYLHVGFIFNQFFRSTMKQANMWVCSENSLQRKKKYIRVKTSQYEVYWVIVSITWRKYFKVFTSPSNCSTNRNTPWAAGCCGPKFSCIFLIYFSGN